MKLLHTKLKKRRDRVSIKHLQLELEYAKVELKYVKTRVMDNFHFIYDQVGSVRADLWATHFNSYKCPSRWEYAQGNFIGCEGIK